MLHGAGATARWTLDETGWDRTAEREGFLAAFPQALPLDPARPMQFHRNPSWWNDASPVARSANRAVDDVHFLNVLLDELERRLPLDPGRLFVSGFSNGAAMTFRLAAEGRRPLTAIAPVAGHCWLEQPRPFRPMPTLYLVGKDDPIVPLNGGRARSPWGPTEERPPIEETVRRWTEALGGQAPFEVQLIEGLGHHWPGGRGTLSRRLFGPPSNALNANDRIWEFCRPHLR